MALDWTPYAIALGGMSSMLMVWLLVMRLWARVFTVGECDVLELREACDSCAHAGQCRLPHPPDKTRLNIDPAARTPRGHGH